MVPSIFAQFCILVDKFRVKVKNERFSLVFSMGRGRTIVTDLYKNQGRFLQPTRSECKKMVLMLWSSKFLF